MNFNLHFCELHSNDSINDKNNLFENYIPKCYNVKRILISFHCFSEYIMCTIIDFNEIDIRIYLPEKKNNSPRPLGCGEYHF